MDYQEDQIEHAQLAFGLATAIVTAKLLIQMEPKMADSFTSSIDQVKNKLVERLNEQISDMEGDEARQRGNNTVQLIEQLAIQYKDELVRS